MSRLKPRASAMASEYPRPIAFSMQLGRNRVVQGLGMSMVALAGLSVLPWPMVLAWTLVAVAAAAVEHHVLRLIARPGAAPAARRAAPVLRVFVTTLYALAAFALISEGGAGERLFAVALMSASMVHVLMRYYRSPWILAASMSPYVLILAVVSVGLMRSALQQGNLFGALVATFTLGTFLLQVWSARAQLSDTWTELMAAREAAEAREHAADAANRAKSEFLATMSHELRTPLNGVLGMTQALTADRLTRVQRERVSIIKRSSESLLAVLNDLLDLSKIEASALELEEVEFDLEHLVRGVIAAYRSLAAKKGLAFDFSVSEEVRGRYLGDSARIRRILYSLCDNAVKFTQRGGVTLRVDGAAGRVVFHVDDTGIGVADDDLSHLFEGFFQADGTLARRYGGAGIGLAICGELTALMGGVVAASSKLGEGSTFTLTLPLKPADAVAAPGPAESPREDPERHEELRVLAAEDNPTNQLVLKTLLASAGIEPTLVADGRQAVDAWERQAWDIVLMDIQMPEMNGLDATLAIRRRELETGRIRTPIVAVTANAMTHQVVEYEAAGMDGVVAKPVDLANLLQVMELALTEADIPPAGRQVAA
jgi:signal transduction histidine kinase/CheY-like chemotaxis protein